MSIRVVYSSRRQLSPKERSFVDLPSRGFPSLQRTENDDGVESAETIFRYAKLGRGTARPPEIDTLIDAGQRRERIVSQRLSPLAAAGTVKGAITIGSNPGGA